MDLDINMWNRDQSEPRKQAYPDRYNEDHSGLTIHLCTPPSPCTENQSMWRGGGGDFFVMMT
jgi:hypothetical protein